METYVGNITKDATIETVNGKEVVKFTIAKNRKFRSEGESRVETLYIECSYWGVPKLQPHLRKGILIEVSGETGVRAWINSQQKAVGQLTLFVHKLDFHNGPTKDRAARNEVV
jgi:single-strand DNA-binding protein